MIPIRWKTVDSHIEERVYTKGTKPAGDVFSIQLNEVMDKWADEARTGTNTISQLWHEESGVMVKLDSGRMLYGDVKCQLTHEISKGGLIQYMMRKNLHWNEKIFQMVDWKGMESTLKRMYQCFQNGTCLAT